MYHQITPKKLSYFKYEINKYVSNVKTLHQGPHDIECDLATFNNKQTETTKEALKDLEMT